MQNNKDVTEYLQTILGYCMTGETDMRSIFIFWGAGSNGKSTLCELIKKILNKFYCAADKKIFIKQDGGSNHTAHLIPLINSRVAVLSETEEKEKLNEGLIKSLTGNDEISARELYGHQFSFKPVCKYLILTNHKPSFNIADQALLDRLKYIPFTARFTDFPKDGEFKRDVKAVELLFNNHLNEVFTWLCIGANRFYKMRKNIKIPKELIDATTSYINEIDNVQQFLNDKCTKTTDGKTKQIELFESYKSYCIENGFRYIRNTEFYSRLLSLNYNRITIHGYPYIKGLKLINYLEI